MRSFWTSQRVLRIPDVFRGFLLRDSCAIVEVLLQGFRPSSLLSWPLQSGCRSTAWLHFGGPMGFAILCLFMQLLGPLYGLALYWGLLKSERFSTCDRLGIRTPPPPQVFGFRRASQVFCEQHHSLKNQQLLQCHCFLWNLLFFKITGCGAHILRSHTVRCAGKTIQGNRDCGGKACASFFQPSLCLACSEYFEMSTIHLLN